MYSKVRLHQNRRWAPVQVRWREKCTHSQVQNKGKVSDIKGRWPSPNIEHRQALVLIPAAASCRNWSKSHMYPKSYGTLLRIYTSHSKIQFNWTSHPLKTLLWPPPGWVQATCLHVSIGCALHVLYFFFIARWWNFLFNYFPLLKMNPLKLWDYLTDVCCMWLLRYDRAVVDMVVRTE